ncbi:PREDICTED: probable F-box protein At1g60180 isoform X2 [Ipomoea nil]|uniref:probable F-box protein At1g60180 isoform X2 n=1 Tax=Ipomoea nil TaxID=35883 RepID=UPI000900F643|nr:PREDICTED: probable F-box protein At1g60180 isoform X2 [Ipomoea nil]
MVPLSPPLSTAEHGGEAEFFALHGDIIESHILTRLDGPTLASTSAVSSALRRFCSEAQLSTAADPRVRAVVSGFPNGGPRAFFAHSFAIPDSGRSRSYSKPSMPAPEELISAVDVRYKGRLIFTKAQETETVTAWFRCSPFRIDLLDPKDVVPTPISHPDGDGACAAFSDDMTLSWILIDPNGRRAVNLSSHKPVSVHRHWLSGEVQAKFASILAVDHRRSHVQCAIVVTCGASEGGEMQVREVSMQMEDMEGTHLNGKDSLVILQRALEGKKGNGSRRVEEGKRRYAEFLEMKREKQERKLRIEGVLDILCVAFGVSAFLVFSYFLLC